MNSRLQLTGCFSMALVLFAAPFTRAEDSAAFTPAMREVSPGVFEIGKLRLDKNKSTVAFPGKINMAADLIEYVLVSPGGPTHESLLVTELQPTDLHFAMLLLGAKGAGLTTPAAGEAPPPQIDAKYLHNAPKLKGDNVLVTATWKDKAGKERMTPVEDWLVHPKTKKAAEPGPWIYTGSMFGADGNFLAQQLGGFIAVVSNPAALINNPRKGNDNDLFWEINAKTVPPIDTPVQITITLQPGSTESK